MMLFIMQTLPWQGGVISPRHVQAPPPYFLVPCTLNRSALLNVPQWLCAQGCVSFGPKIHFFPVPSSKHYLPRPWQIPPPSVSAICCKLAAINWKTMAGPSRRVKAICIEATLGRPLISSLSRKRLPLTLASEDVWAHWVCSLRRALLFWAAEIIGLTCARGDSIRLCLRWCYKVLINAEGNNVELISRDRRFLSAAQLDKSSVHPGRDAEGRHEGRRFTAWRDASAQLIPSNAAHVFPRTFTSPCLRADSADRIMPSSVRLDWATLGPW